MLLLFIRSNVAAFQRFRLDGVLSVADRLLMIIVCGALLFLPAFAGLFAIEWFVWAQVACYAAAIVLGFYLLWRITAVAPSLSFHFEKVWDMMKSAAPYALLIFLMSVYMRVDIPLIERLHSAEEAGRYISASRQLDVSNQFAILFAGILLPLFGRMLSEGKNVASIVRLSANLLLPLSFLGAVLAWMAGAGIMHLLYPAADAYDGRVFAWVMSCLPACSLMYIYSTLLTANGALGLLNRLAAGAAILNVGLNFFIIPRFGAEGAAMVACATQWGIAAASVILAARRNRLPLHPKWVASHVVYLLLLTAVGLGARHYWDGAWKPTALSILLASGVLIMAFRFVTPSMLRQFLSRR
jgi:O-antigen/teichoic acid export membrane protein